MAEAESTEVDPLVVTGSSRVIGRFGSSKTVEDEREEAIQRLLDICKE